MIDKTESKKYVVTIDGAAGTGKSTAAENLSIRLGWLYVNSGFIYRAATLLAIRAGLYQGKVKTDDEMEMEIVREMQATKFEFVKHKDSWVHLLLNGEDVTSDLKSHEVEIRVSINAQYMKVRAETVKIQHAEAAKHSIVVEGRDTGTVVFPQADVKFYLTATVQVQAERQMKDRVRRGDPELTIDELMTQIRERDLRDLQKHLRKPEDAIEIETDNINAVQVVDRLEVDVRKRLNL